MPRATRVGYTKQYADEVLSQSTASRRRGEQAGHTGIGHDQQSWQPTATLVMPLSAPFASRVSLPAAAASYPSNGSMKPLEELSRDEQESAIMEDVLTVFLGLEGQYIQFASNYQAQDEDVRLTGPDYVVLPGLLSSMYELVKPMLSMATHHLAICAFMELQSKAECGKVIHAMCAAMRATIKDYLMLVMQLEQRCLVDTGFTLHAMSIQLSAMKRKLHHLYSIVTQVVRENYGVGGRKSSSASDKEDISEPSWLELAGEVRTHKSTCKGGAVLELISRRLILLSGDPSARDVLSSLLELSSQPYMDMLHEWLRHGILKDPHQEFIIQEQDSIRKEHLEKDYIDEYWEKRFTIRTSPAPPQLVKVQEKILLAGKYLNVLRECGDADSSEKWNTDVQVLHAINDSRLLKTVNLAYHRANSSLLTLLFKVYALPERLRSLKHYFFLDRSDFLSHFLELSKAELRKPARVVSISKLQALFELAIHQPSSVAAADPFKEDVRIVMSETGLLSWLMKIVSVKGLDAEAEDMNVMDLAPQSASDTKTKGVTGFDALSLDFTVPFPLSLVISRVMVTRYQLIFRHLLSLKHLEALLVSSWTTQYQTRTWRHKSSLQAIEQWKRRAWTLKTKMLFFVQQMLYFCTNEVIEPNWSKFWAQIQDSRDMHQSEALSSTPLDPNVGFEQFQPAPDNGRKIRTVDEIMQDHVDMLASCLKECMLTNGKLIRTITKLITICTLFADYSASLSRNLGLADHPLMAEPDAKVRSIGEHSLSQHDPLRLRKLQNILANFEENFERYLRSLLDRLEFFAATETPALSTLHVRLSMAYGSSYEDSISLRGFG